MGNKESRLERSERKQLKKKGKLPVQIPQKAPITTQVSNLGPPTITLLRAYEYRQLESARHFRLLRVPAPPPGQRTWTAEDDPEFEIIHASLDRAPSYTTISYTWGDPSSQGRIPIVGNVLFPVTMSLAQLLANMIGGGQSGFFWIDQICINQKHHAEKSHQVSLMTEIYQRADAVNVWLGFEDRHTPVLEQLISIIGSQPHAPHRCEEEGHREFVRQESQKVRDLLVHHPMIRSVGGSITEPGWNDPYLKAVDALLNRQWFSRTWTIQEIVVSKDVSFHIGGFCISLRDLDRLITYILFCDDLEAESHYTSTMKNFSRGYYCFTTTIHKREEYMQRLRSSPTESLTKEDLGTYLSRIGGNCEATNPRDFIYAHLGFQRDGTHMIRPNYALSVQDVFTNATVALLNSSGTLDALAFVRHSIEEKGNFYRGERFTNTPISGLPSWVPDWSTRLQNNPIYTSEATCDFSACGSYAYRPEVPHNPAHLLIRGRKIDVVLYTSLQHQKYSEFENHGDFLMIQKHLEGLIMFQLAMNIPLNMGHSPFVFDAITMGGATVPELGIRQANLHNMPMDMQRYEEAMTQYVEYGQDIKAINEEEMAGGDNVDIENLQNAMNSVLASKGITLPEPIPDRTPEQIARLKAMMGMFHAKLNRGRNPRLSARHRAEMDVLRRSTEWTKCRALIYTASGRMGIAAQEVEIGDSIVIAHGAKAPIVVKDRGDGTYMFRGMCYVQDGVMFGDAVSWAEDQADLFVLS